MMEELEAGWTGPYDEDPEVLAFPKTMTPLGDAVHPRGRSDGR